MKDSSKKGGKRKSQPQEEFLDEGAEEVAYEPPKKKTKKKLAADKSGKGKKGESKKKGILWSFKHQLVLRCHQRCKIERPRNGEANRYFLSFLFIPAFYLFICRLHSRMHSLILTSVSFCSFATNQTSGTC